MFSETTGHLSIEQKIGVNLDGILLDTEIVLQLSLVTIQLLVKGLRLPEVIVQHLQGVQDVGHFRDQLSLGWIALFLLDGLLSSTDNIYIIHISISRNICPRQPPHNPPSNSIMLPFNFLSSHVEPCLGELQGTSFGLNGIPEFFYFLCLGRHLSQSLSESLVQADHAVVQQVQLFPQVTVGFLPMFDQVSTERSHQGLDVSSQLLRVISGS